MKKPSSQTVKKIAKEAAIPVTIFGGSSAIAYNTLPEVSNTFTHVAASGAVGVGATLGTGAGYIAGIFATLFGVTVIDKLRGVKIEDTDEYTENGFLYKFPKTAVAGLHACTLGMGALTGVESGVLTHQVMDHLLSDEQDQTQSLSQQEMAGYDQPAPLVNEETGQTFQLTF